MRSEFMLAINQLCAERRISSEVVLQAVEAALISAYKRNFGVSTNVEVKIEPTSGDVRVFAAKEVVETVEDPKAEILLADALLDDPDAAMGDTVLVETTPKDFGRIAAQTAKQVILQRIREAERDALYSSFADSAGEIAHGTVQSVDYHSRDVIVNLDGAEAILPAREQVPSERYRRSSRLRAYVLEVRRGSRGPQITLSRRSPAFLRRLLELEVPEIFNGIVEIKSIAREAGSRSKVAVHATQEGVDPVGSCVGVRGGRIQNVVNELGGEKIDIVQWDPAVTVFVANSLSPAKVMNVLLDENPETGKTATVIVPDRQLSLAIGKEGQNARLAAKLTGWRIDIKSATEAAEETLGRLEDSTLPPEEMDLLSLAEVILHKRDMSELTEEEQALIEGQVGSAPEAAPGSTDEEPEATAEPTAEDEQEPVPDEVPAAVDEAMPDSEVKAGAADELEPGADASEAEPIVEPEDLEPADGLPDDSEVQPVDEDALPVIDGEPIEATLGWVVTETADDLYSGWDDYVEETPAVETEQWEREEFTEEERAPRQPARKTKKKKRGRRPRTSRRESDW